MTLVRKRLLIASAIASLFLLCVFVFVNFVNSYSTPTSSLYSLSIGRSPVAPLRVSSVVSTPKTTVLNWKVALLVVVVCIIVSIIIAAVYLFNTGHESTDHDDMVRIEQSKDQEEVVVQQEDAEWWPWLVVGAIAVIIFIVIIMVLVKKGNTGAKGKIVKGSSSVARGSGEVPVVHGSTVTLGSRGEHTGSSAGKSADIHVGSSADIYVGDHKEVSLAVETPIHDTNTSQSDGSKKDATHSTAHDTVAVLDESILQPKLVMNTTRLLQGEAESTKFSTNTPLELPVELIEPPSATVTPVAQPHQPATPQRQTQLDNQGTSTKQTQPQQPSTPQKQTQTSPSNVSQLKAKFTPSKPTTPIAYTEPKGTPTKKFVFRNSEGEIDQEFTEYDGNGFLKRLSPVQLARLKEKKKQ